MGVYCFRLRKLAGFWMVQCGLLQSRKKVGVAIRQW